MVLKYDRVVHYIGQHNQAPTSMCFIDLCNPIEPKMS